MFIHIYVFVTSFERGFGGSAFATKPHKTDWAGDLSTIYSEPDLHLLIYHFMPISIDDPRLLLCQSVRYLDGERAT